MLNDIFHHLRTFPPYRWIDDLLLRHLLCEESGSNSSWRVFQHLLVLNGKCLASVAAHRHHQIHHYDEGILEKGYAIMYHFARDGLPFALF